MEKLFVFILISLFVLPHSYVVLAQETKKDYIIHFSGDKTPGTIIRSHDFVQSSSIRFVDGSGETHGFTPAQIEGFELENGRYFVSRVLPDVKEKVFAQVIFSGRFNLLLYVDKYYIENPLEILELKSIPLVTVDEREVDRVNTSYIRVLSDHMAGYCGSKLKLDIIETRLLEEDLVRILTKYHKCEGLSYTLYVEKIPQVVLRPMILGGFSHHALSPKSVGYSRTDEIEDPLAVNLQGILRFFPSRKYPRLSFDLGLGYSTFKSSLHSELVVGQTTYASDSNLDYSSLYVPGFVNYSFVRVRRTNFYGGVGFVYRKDKLIARNISSSQNYPNGVVSDFSSVSLKQTYYNPALKLGLDVEMMSKLGLVGEIHLDYLSENYHIYMTTVNNRSVYNRLMTGLMVGLRF